MPDRHHPHSSGNVAPPGPEQVPSRMRAPHRQQRGSGARDSEARLVQKRPRAPGRRDDQRPPANDMTITTAIRIASTSSAIFHGLFGYSPSIAPVTPFIAHW